MDTIKIGQYIRAQRKAQGLTQQQLAQRMNVSFQAVSKWEKGDAVPDVSLLLDLADVLNTTTDKLLSGGTVIAGERKRMRAADVIEGFSHIEAVGRCLGEESTFFTGMIEGINKKMDVDILAYLRDPQTRSMMVLEALIQGVMNGFSLDMDEVAAHIQNPRMIEIIRGYLDNESANRLFRFAEGYRKARRIDEGQIIVVSMQNGSIRMFENDLTEEKEQSIISELKAPVSELLCCGCGGEVAAPSEHIRSGLLAAFADNASAIVYLKGEENLIGRKLSELA